MTLIAGTLLGVYGYLLPRELAKTRPSATALVLSVGAVVLLLPAFWSGEACYLQDLFTDEAARGRGAARALIEGVAAAARERGADRFYWHTQETNTTARVLYDKVARFTGFIRYSYRL